MRPTKEILDPSNKSTEAFTSPAAFFRAVHHAFLQSEQASGGLSEYFYTIGDYPIRLCFAGSALIPLLTPALGHLASSARPAPALTVCVWESDQTGMDMPPAPPWSWDDYVARGEVRGYNDPRIYTAFHGSNALSMLDAGVNLAVCWVRDANQLPAYESGSPLLRILHWWMQRRGLQLIHAGAVGTQEGGVLLVGKGGSGKSTAALACLQSTLSYAGDDYCLITADPRPRVYSVYNSGKVDAADIHRFPLLAPALSNAKRLEKEKALYFLYKHFPEKISAGFPLRAILLPRVTHRRETKLKRMSPSAGLLALAPSTIFQLPGAGQQAFATLSAIAKHVPSYILEVGTDLTRIPDTILHLLAEPGVPS